MIDSTATWDQSRTGTGSGPLSRTGTMLEPLPDSRPDATVWGRALEARDPRFDGLFFVGITTTMIYCRPVCPARVSYPERRRFFDTAAAAEREGFRPCLRCRPELAPGRAMVDAVPRLARAAAQCIAAGALNGRGVGQLARDLGVGERQLRRAMQREFGVSPVELAQTHRLLLAKRLLTDTTLPVTRVAYASGFQSLRRFNTAFQHHYRMSPSLLRGRSGTLARGPASSGDLVRLTLGYRAPLDWGQLLRRLAAEAISGVEVVEGGRYGRTVDLEGCRGVVFADATAAENGPRSRRGGLDPHVIIEVSCSLLGALMPLLARLRHQLDLDAEPAVIDAHLARGGLGEFVARHPGLRLPGGFDGFEVVLREVLRSAEVGGGELERRVVDALGESIPTGSPALNRLTPSARRVAAVGASALEALGVPDRQSRALVALAQALAYGSLRLEPGADAPSTLGRLRESFELSERVANAIVMRALHWPDAFPSTDPTLLGVAGVASPRTLLGVAECWRPWRAYAAGHLGLAEGSDRAAGPHFKPLPGDSTPH